MKDSRQELTVEIMEKVAGGGGIEVDPSIVNPDTDVPHDSEPFNVSDPPPITPKNTEVVDWG